MNAEQRRCISLVHERAISVFPEAVVGPVMPCEICGIWGGRRELHHRKFRSRMGQWSAANIVLLCPICHLKATDERHEVEGVNVASWEDPTEVPVKLWYTDTPVCLDDDGGYDPCCET